MACCGESTVKQDVAGDEPLSLPPNAVPHVTIDPNVMIETIAHMTRGLPVLRQDTSGRPRKRFLVLGRGFDVLSYSPSRKPLALRSLDLKRVTGISVSTADTPPKDGDKEPPQRALIVKCTSARNEFVFAFEDSESARAVAESLAYLVRKRITMHDEAAQRMAMIDLWVGSKLNSDGELPFAGLVRIAERLGWTWPRADLRQWFNEMDGENGSGGLDFGELCRFFEELTMRQQLAPLFMAYAESRDRLLMSPQRVVDFFKGAQGETLSNAAAAQFVRQHGADPEYWSFSDFCQFLTSPRLNSWLHPVHTAVHHDMTQPLHHYFISTSHNTAVVGSQLDADMDPLGISGALQMGARCVDLAVTECEGETCIWRPFTFTSPIPALPIVEAIHANAFVASDFPVIINVEVYGGTKAANTFAGMLRDVLGSALHVIRPGILKTRSAAAHLKTIHFRDKRPGGDLSITHDDDVSGDFSMDSLDAEDDFTRTASDEKAFVALGRARTASRKARGAMARLEDHRKAIRAAERDTRSVMRAVEVLRELEAERQEALDAIEAKKQLRRQLIAQGMSTKAPVRVPMAEPKLFESPATFSLRQSRVYHERTRLRVADAMAIFLDAVGLADRALRVACETNEAHRQSQPDVTDSPQEDATIDEVLPPELTGEIDPFAPSAGTVAGATVEDEGQVMRDAANAVAVADATEELTEYLRGLASRANALREFTLEVAASARVTPQSLKRRFLLAYKCHTFIPDHNRSTEHSAIFNRNRERFATTNAESLMLCGMSSFTSCAVTDDWQSTSRQRLRAVPEAVCVSSIREATDATHGRPRGRTISANRNGALVFAFPESDESSNDVPFGALAVGTSMVAMNFQTFDEPMRLYDAFFRLNGRCGYVLKPEYLRHTGILPGNQPFIFTVRILMGTQLPGPEIDRKNHSTRWKVITGIESPPDENTHEGRTRRVSSTQTSERAMPYWNEAFSFQVTNVALSMLTIRIVDEEPDFDNDVAEAAVPLVALRLGYRAVPLMSSVSGNPLAHASLLIHVAVTRTTALTEVRNEAKMGLAARRRSVVAPRPG